MKNDRPEQIIQDAAETFKKGLVMTSSFGADSAMMLHMVTGLVPKIPVILINTGYLFPETEKFILRLTEKFRLNLKIFSSRETPESFERTYGRLWEKGEEGIRQYNNLQKVLPMQNALRFLKAKAVISGVRSEQTENRASLKKVEYTDDGLYRIYPILSWDTTEVEEYFKKHNLPRHPLVAQGYESIGDTHSTIPGKGREGRLLGVKQECGIHLDYMI